MTRAFMEFASWILIPESIHVRVILAMKDMIVQAVSVKFAFKNINNVRLYLKYQNAKPGYTIFMLYITNISVLFGQARTHLCTNKKY